MLLFFSHIKVRKLNFIKKQKRIQKQVVKEIKSLLKKRKTRSKKSGHEKYKTLPEDEKQKLVAYRKKYYKIWENKNASQIQTDRCF